MDGLDAVAGDEAARADDAVGLGYESSDVVDVCVLMLMVVVCEEAHTIINIIITHTLRGGLGEWRSQPGAAWRSSPAVVAFGVFHRQTSFLGLDRFEAGCLSGYYNNGRWV